MLYKLDKLRRQMRREGAPNAFLTTFGSNEIQSTLLAKWNIRVVNLDPAQSTDSLADFLESLI